MVDRLRIAILTHSTNPRGSVVHALALGEALCGLGHEAVVHAPDPTGRGFFRGARCPVVSVAGQPVTEPTVALVRARIADFLAHFSTPAACEFDVFHAHCGISGNALATLTRRRLIPGFVRTVHHIDTFSDPQLAQLQERAIVDATRLLCVSRTWAATLAAEYGAQADVVGNGVDGTVFTPDAAAEDAELRRGFGLGPGPVFLSVGGFEARKNTLAIIEAFAMLRRRVPGAQLLVTGGASLLDHAGYEARCCAALEREGLEVGPGRPVIRTGPIAQADMPGLYRAADTLVFPSLKEGYGLCVLEAMACGTPVIVSARPPFTEYLAPGEALSVDPDDTGAIAATMLASLEPGRRGRLRNAGREVARAHAWEACAARHLPSYAALAPGPAPVVAVATGSAAWNITRRPGDA
ncbi:MSMEG_0565 family glycosyltransferase [Methylobacterium sp. NEAU K]|uniref:MSMEG_0565 family glycosyltransferase n=1 Tax=Methylobacterium sp. NEAU K TaxID=3064946 RepID=UPI00273301C8|nr:MSMEG_0565 family glycosyltransferase [Methylobacterium sp. NEAU K]MDP4002374.1 MSMEG_0565 family glycosyltransferase [Methylobacterium sp. NEAU K]